MIEASSHDARACVTLPAIRRVKVCDEQLHNALVLLCSLHVKHPEGMRRCHVLLLLKFAHDQAKASRSLITIRQVLTSWFRRHFAGGSCVAVAGAACCCCETALCILLLPCFALQLLLCCQCLRHPPLVLPMLLLGTVSTHAGSGLFFDRLSDWLILDLAHSQPRPRSRGSTAVVWSAVPSAVES